MSIIISQEAEDSIDKFAELLKRNFPAQKKSFLEYNDDDEIWVYVKFDGNFPDDLIEKLAQESGFSNFYESTGSGCGFGYRDISFSPIA